MKDNLEQKFKELLDNQELPYDPAAWDLMRNALDSKMPVTKPTNWYRWFLTGAAITAFAFGAYFIYTGYTSNSNLGVEKIEDTTVKLEDRKTENSKDSKTSQKSNNNIDIAKKDIQHVAELTSINNDDIINPNTQNNAKELEILSNSTSNDKTDDKSNFNAIPTVANVNTTLGSSQNHKGSERANETKINNTNLESILVNNMCVGESQKIENKNNFDVSILNSATGNVVKVIKSNDYSIFNASESGNYELISKGDLQFIEPIKFVVSSVASPTLDVESEVIYLKGVPTIKASTDENTTGSWSVDDKTIAQSKREVEFNPFLAREYSISITVNENGCSITKSESIQISEDYNLLAPNAFSPTSIISENQTFMPYALTVREVKFKLIILDPKDGGLIYETDNSSMAWDGVDKRNGQQVPANQTYIWNVKLDNPLPGEANEYKGTITKL